MKTFATIVVLLWLIFLVPAVAIGLSLTDPLPTVLLPRSDLPPLAWIGAFLVLYLPPVLGIWLVWTALKNWRRRTEHRSR